MIKYAAVPVIAILAACSAEVEDSQAADANRIETLSVNNLVITEANTAINSAIEAQSPPPAQPAQTTASTAPPRAATTEPKQRPAREPAAEAAAKPSTKLKTAEPAQPGPETEASNAACTDEHREMGHC